VIMPGRFEEAELGKLSLPGGSCSKRQGEESLRTPCFLQIARMAADRGSWDVGVGMTYTLCFTRLVRMADAEDCLRSARSVWKGGS